MRTIQVLLVLLLVMFAAASIIGGGLALTKLTSFTVPELGGSIEQVILFDINNSGLPEAIGSDGEFIYCYSALTNQMLLKDALPTSITSHKIAAGDVNRDNISDIVLVYETQGSEFHIVVYDGATGFSKSVDTIFATTALSGNNKAMKPDVAILDYNQDGYTELIASHLVVETESVHVYSAGITYLFYSFPDSLAYELDEQLFNFVQLPPIDGKQNIGSARIDHSIQGIGDVITLRLFQSLRIIAADGTTSPLTNRLEIDYCSGGDVSNIYADGSYLGCIIPGENSYSVVNTFTSFHNCTSDIEGNIVSSVNHFQDVSKFEVDASGPQSPDWTVAIPPELDYIVLDHFLYDESYPDNFFCFWDDSLQQRSVATGEIVSKMEAEPANLRFWHQGSVFGYDGPFLVQVSGNSVSIYTLDTSTDTPDDQNKLLPSSPLLGSPYPNPFNPTVSFSLHMQERGGAKVELFNVTGQRIAVIFDGTAPAGETSLVWNGSDYASGIYLIRATTAGKTETVKAMLLK